MKTSEFILSCRLEDWIEFKLKKAGKEDLVANVKESFKFDITQFTKDTDFHQILEFKKGEKIINEGTEEFEGIISLLEEQRSLLSRYKRMEQLIKKNAPELMEEDLPEIMPIAVFPTLYISIAIATMILILTFTYKFLF